MTNDTMARINELTARRASLYREAPGRLSAAELRARAGELTRQIEELWDRRRQERAGRLGGIDLLVEASYREAYGPRFDEAAAPGAAGDGGRDRELTKAA
jgi:hypothetical protein